MLAEIYKSDCLELRYSVLLCVCVCVCVCVFGICVCVCLLIHKNANTWFLGTFWDSAKEKILK